MILNFQHDISTFQIWQHCTKASGPHTAALFAMSSFSVWRSTHCTKPPSHFNADTCWNGKPRVPVCVCAYLRASLRQRSQHLFSKIGRFRKTGDGKAKACDLNDVTSVCEFHCTVFCVFVVQTCCAYTIFIMSWPHASGDKSDPVVKKVCKTLYLEVKSDVIRGMMSGDRAVDVGRHWGLPPTTVRTIYKNAEQIRESAKRAPPLTSKLIMKRSSSYMGKMEWMLDVWIEDLNRMRTPVSEVVTQHGS